MSEIAVLAEDENKIKSSVRAGFPFTIVSCALPPATETRIARAIASFLRLAGREDLQNYIEYCVRELSVNAKKANTKRVYFIEKGLDINDSADYALGMRTFKTDTLGSMPRYLRLQKDAGLYVKIRLQCRLDAVQIEVCNNAAASRVEMERVRARIAVSREADDFGEVLGRSLDNTEGAGLGLAVLVLILRRLGLGDGSFDLSSTEKETSARIVIPFEEAALARVRRICADAAAQTDSLPHFPDSLTGLRQTLCTLQSGGTDITDAAVKISADPVMTADLIRLANSAADTKAARIGSVPSAARIVGPDGLRSLFEDGAARALPEKYAELLRQPLLHCRETAHYAFNLALNFFGDAAFAEDAYLGGLLHDIGKVVFADEGRGFFAETGVPDHVFEEVRAGMNHAEVGALLAEKWNFPAKLVSAVRFHHTPALAPDRYRPLADAVHLADVFSVMAAGMAVFEQADSASLARFGITARAQAEKLIKTFSFSFNRRKI